MTGGTDVADAGAGTGAGVGAGTADLLRRSPVQVTADPRRVAARLFLPGQELTSSGPSRADGVIARCLALSDQQVGEALADLLSGYGARHRDLPGVLDEHFRAVSHRVPDAGSVAADRRRLIGAHFTREVAVETAAVLNPSVVPHPVQDGPPGSLRFVMSVRAVGEGHLSTVTFRSGTLLPGGSAGRVVLDPPSVLVEHGSEPEGGSDRERLGLARRHSYAVSFPPGSALGERTLFPALEVERSGMEDARFVRLTGPDGGCGYAATYTGFDGMHVTSRRLDTQDFRTFRSAPLTGGAAADKGMALFPRQVGGRYLALSRWDRENNVVASSDDGFHWVDGTRLQAPAEGWEAIQLGNCGSPLETDHGWLVLTHGVGPMRAYAIGALLLDLDRPDRVIGRLTEPLLRPDPDERDGYVPNVVYSCGGLIHQDTLLIPYGCSDSRIRFALVDLPALLGRLSPGSGPALPAAR